jgi:hypothetical protein
MSLAYVPALNAGLSAVGPDQSGLASGLLGTSYHVGSALGLAVMTSIATSYGADQLGHVAALTNGYQAAFLRAAGVAVAAALACSAPRAAPSPTRRTQSQRATIRPRRSPPSALLGAPAAALRGRPASLHAAIITLVRCATR